MNLSFQTRIEHWLKRPVSLVLVVLYKGVLGVVEIVTGSALLIFALISESHRLALVLQIVANELREDPQDRLVHWILNNVSSFDARASSEIGILVIFLGLIKIAIAFGVWFRSRRMRIVTIILLSLSSLLAVYELIWQFSVIAALAILADLLVLFYVWRVLPKYLPKI